MASRCSAAASLPAKTPPVVHATTSRQLLNSTLDLLLLALGVDAAAVECDVVGSFSDFHCLRLFWPEEKPACCFSAISILTIQICIALSCTACCWAGRKVIFRWRRATARHLVIQPVCRRPSGERPQPLPQTGDPARSAGSDAQRGALSWRDCCETVGPEGVSWLLHQLRSHLAGEHPPAACQSVHQIALSRLWQQILRKTGNAEIRRLTPPHHDRLAGFYNDDDKEAL